jgi:hypothetical protein
MVIGGQIIDSQLNHISNILRTYISELIIIRSCDVQWISEPDMQVKTRPQKWESWTEPNSSERTLCWRVTISYIVAWLVKRRKWEGQRLWCIHMMKEGHSLSHGIGQLQATKGESLPNKFLKETHFSRQNPTLRLCLVLQWIYLYLLWPSMLFWRIYSDFLKATLCSVCLILRWTVILTY